MPDRLSTAGLLAILGMLSPRWYFGFLALLMLDIFSHWFQMYATMASGATTHKVAFPFAPLFNPLECVICGLSLYTIREYWLSLHVGTGVAVCRYSGGLLLACEQLAS